MCPIFQTSLADIAIAVFTPTHSPKASDGGVMRTQGFERPRHWRELNSNGDASARESLVQRATFMTHTDVGDGFMPYNLKAQNGYKREHAFQGPTEPWRQSRVVGGVAH